MAARARGRRSRGKHEEGHGTDERWLLTYSDLITLLMALFVIFFAMSSADQTKYEKLKSSLSAAFDGHILGGGQSVLEQGGTDAAVKPLDQAKAQAQAAKQETESLNELKRRIDAYAAAHQLQSKIDTRVERRGLVVAILTDRLLFDSGSAELRPEGAALMTSIGAMLRREAEHQIEVEGYTDNVPIRNATYPTNWELSTARASTVVRTFLRANVAPQRLTAAGRAYLDPVASNATESGRLHNRRVQVVIPRKAPSPDGPAATPSVSVPPVDIGAKEAP